ncbi:MAG: S-DNA-T family DNA segregation ATPase FtsK/SpoIIIE [Glaciecola sp.]|jgi:S-DNA-T family DNA segregation ATPase FtsK/SpoIIIE
MFGKKKEERKANTLKKKASENKKEFKLELSQYFKFPKIKAFFENEKKQYVIGFVLIFIGIYLLFSFTSYFFSWKIDQDKIQSWSAIGTEAFNELEQQAANNAGTLGAKIAHFFIHQLVGVSAYALPVLLIMGGFKLSFKKQLFPFGQTAKVLVFYAFLGASTLSLLFPDAALNPGGTFGHQLNLWLEFLLGKTGLIILLSLSAIISLLSFFNIRIDALLTKLSAKSTEEENVSDETTQSASMSFTNDGIATSHTVIPDVQNETIDLSTEQLNETVSEPVSHTDEANTDEVFDDNAINMDVTTPTEAAQPLDESDMKLEVEEAIEEETVEKALPNSTDSYDPTLDLSSYKFPTIDLLKDYEAGNAKAVDTETLEKNKNNIVNTLKNYKIEIASIKASIGPTVTLYEIVPAPGVRISKIKSLEDDIALSLAALGIRIIAPIPGRGTIGIEVPNPNPDVVAMRTVIASKAFAETTMDLPIALGKTISNETLVVDLAKMPHLLMAGATGQGKSVGLNCILVSLLYKKHPSQLKFVLVDPKKVELTLFNKIERHYLAKLPDTEEAIITETSKVVNTLNSLCVEMDQRYELLKQAQCRNLKEYNTKFIARKLNPENGHRFLPFIVLVVDEFADLIMTAGKEVETPIARLAQLARAIGIHLIIATQRPSVNIITGTIKANFPARIAFRVTSKIDSRTILDAGGADQLIGRGDLLLTTGNELVRVQCAFVDTPEVENITNFIGDQRGYPDAFLLPEVADIGDPSATGNPNIQDRDVLFVDAAKVVVMHQQGSASLLQRKLKLGYNRAGRIVDQLEEAGIIGPFEGSKARQVLIPDEASLEQYLNHNEDE